MDLYVVDEESNDSDNLPKNINNVCNPNPNLPPLHSSSEIEIEENIFDWKDKSQSQSPIFQINLEPRTCPELVNENEKVLQEIEQSKNDKNISRQILQFQENIQQILNQTESLNQQLLPSSPLDFQKKQSENNLLKMPPIPNKLIPFENIK